MFDKHFENEGLSWCAGNKVSKSVSLRLSEIELKMLSELYPHRGISYAIRSLIHKAYENVSR